MALYHRYRHFLFSGLKGPSLKKALQKFNARGRPVVPYGTTLYPVENA